MQTTLLDSSPLVARTSPLAVCDRADDGGCLPAADPVAHPNNVKVTDGAYFSFSVTRDMDVQTVDLSVEVLNAAEAIKVI